MNVICGKLQILMAHTVVLLVLIASQGRDATHFHDGVPVCAALGHQCCICIIEQGLRHFRVCERSESADGAVEFHVLYGVWRADSLLEMSGFFILS